MTATILDERNENSSKCFLVKIILKDYVENLSDDYKDYEIQREIVTNSYLDSLVETVLKKLHIPPIVLIIDIPKINGKILTIDSFKILDGLQRTYRLNAIWKTLNFFNEELKKGVEILSMTKYNLSKKYSQELVKFDSSTKILQTIISYYNTKKDEDGFDLFDPFTTNYQWFEIWSGLSADEEVTKMLVLNAGHKPVKIKHQLELLFRNIIPLLEKTGFAKFELVREREVSAIQFSKNRKVGSFHFSHVIASILSFKDGQPVTTNSAYIQKLQNSDFDSETDSQYFTFTFLEAFIGSLIHIDNIISLKFNDLGTKWMGREVTLVGIYAALGDYVKKEKIRFPDAFLNLTSLISQYTQELNLSNFEKERNRLDLSKVNIGNANKNAVFHAFKDILRDQKIEDIDWLKYFNSSEV